MRKNSRVWVVLAILLTVCGVAAAQSFTMEQIKGYPYPTDLAASTGTPRIAWVFNERGVRNVWVADAPDYTARKLTNYTADDGQEIVSVAVSADGKWVVYVRGGSEGNWSDVPPNPAQSATEQKMQMWSVPFAGGEPKVLADANGPVLSPKSDVVAFGRGGAIMTVPIDGSAAAKRLFSARGSSGSPEWSPDGSRMAFVSGRGAHSFIGVYTNDSTPILWLQPSTGRDGSPRWSPDGKRIAFVRRSGSGGEPDALLVPTINRWSIWTADVSTGDGKQLWKSPNTLRGNAPTTLGGTNLHWAANNRIIFSTYIGGQPQVYSINDNGGGEPLLLTPGNYMAEWVRLSPDKKWVIVSGNAGSDPEDIDRRHLVRVPVDRAAPEVLTPGDGLEWNPRFTGDGKTIVFISATAQRPPLPTVMSADGKNKRLIGEDRIPRDFPTQKLIKPKQVIITAPDGVKVHCQLFDAGGGGKKPAVVYVHGGPPRQMLLGWNYSDYYSNVYALNQYLASKGYVVLSVNFRLGIGYGYEFHNPANAGWRGASEYQDVKAAGDYLQKLPQVDPKRIGIWGGSYGGFLTAMALARDSNIFAAGVDLHGVHDWTAFRSFASFLITNPRDSYETAPDLQLAIDTAWRASPISSMATWTSPVLLIHGDDDRNVRFEHTIDLVQRLEKAGVPYEELVLPDEVHGFLRHASWMKANKATVDFLDKYLKPSNR